MGATRKLKDSPIHNPDHTQAQRSSAEIIQLDDRRPENFSLVPDLLSDSELYNVLFERFSEDNATRMMMNFNREQVEAVLMSTAQLLNRPRRREEVVSSDPRTRDEILAIMDENVVGGFDGNSTD